MPIPSSTQFDVIVAGVGSVGSAACYHLARRGARVLGLERFEIPHDHGSYHGHSRMIREAYFEHPDYVPLLRRAYELWGDLQSACGDAFFHIGGGIYVGAEDGTIVPGSLLAAREHGIDHALLSADEIRARYPVMSPPPGQVGFYENRCGFLVPEKAVRAHADAARSHGAILQTGERLESWQVHADGVEVSTDRARYTADQLVITSGAWSAEVAQDLGIELQVTRQVLAWFEPLGDPEKFAPGNFPCWFVETGAPVGHYGFPVLSGDPGLKIAVHRPGEVIDPNTTPGPPSEDEIGALHATLDEIFPGCAGALAEACTCKYTNSPDGHFVVGAHPAHQGVSLACGLSGHGFKFASVLGEALADLAQDGATDLPIGFLSPARFG